MNVSSRKGLVWLFNILSTQLSLIKSRYCGGVWLLRDSESDKQSSHLWVKLSHILTCCHLIWHMAVWRVTFCHIMWHFHVLSQGWYHMIEQLLQAIPHCCPSVPAVCWTIRLLKKSTIKNIQVDIVVVELKNCFRIHNVQSRPDAWASELNCHVTLNEWMRKGWREIILETQDQFLQQIHKYLVHPQMMKQIQMRPRNIWSFNFFWVLYEASALQRRVLVWLKCQGFSLQHCKLLE